MRAHEVNRRLAARGVVVLQLAGAFPGARDREVEPGYRVRHIGLRRPYPLSRLSFGLLAGRALGRSEFDVAVVDFSVYTPVRSPSPGTPVVCVVHHLTGPWAQDRWGRLPGAMLVRHEARRLRRFSVVSADSPATARDVRRAVAPGTAVRTIENGVDPALFTLRRAPEDPPFLLYLGRLDLYHKGLDMLLEAFARIAPHHPGLTLRIAGRGRDAEAVGALVRSSPVADRIRLLGPVTDAAKLDLLSAAAAVVMPSRMEGWGMVAAEAMAAGAPLVCSNAGSLPDLVGDAALVAPAGDVTALVASLERILADAPLRQRLSTAGRAAARARFDWEAITTRHHDLLRSVAASSHR